MKLVWSRLALADREAIFDHIQDFSPQAAASIDARISDVVGRLADFPLSGRQGRVEETREIVITGTPYVAAYLATGQTVRILRVLHGANLARSTRGIATAASA